MNPANSHAGFQAMPQKTTSEQIALDVPAVVIVGSGPVGMCFASELSRRKASMPMVIYGAEPWQPYDRVRLSSYLAGDVKRHDLSIAFDTNQARAETRFNCPVTDIDRDNRTVTDANGRVQHYSHLVLAVGSKPFVPGIHNIDLSGVYTFRSLSEADHLFARTTHTRQTVVLGGGLLGLETARAMRRYNTHITIIEHNHWLMLQQLDAAGGAELKRQIEAMGMDVVLADSVIGVLGTQRVAGVKLRSGIKIDCDTFIIATGIRANIDLAKQAGLAFSKGIRINDALQTSDPNIYAIGECAEYQGQVYGLVKPGIDMATVLADRIAGGQSRYTPSLGATQLKVMRQTVFSVGRIGNDEDTSAGMKEYVYASNAHGVYRKVRVHYNRIIGVIAIGNWHEASLLQDAIKQKRRVWVWHLTRFVRYGYLWSEEGEKDVAAWPAAAIVCNCASVNRGRLTYLMENGCDTVACFGAQTRAGTICGSCTPLLVELIGGSAKAEPVRAWRTLLALSALGISLVVLFVLIWRIPYADSVQVSLRWDEIWRDELFKQISGFSILGLVVMGMLMSLRKRTQRFTLGDYNLWRLAHIALGVLALTALIAHTGFRLGEQINLILMMNFLLLAVLGANASTVIANEHKMAAALAKRQRAKWGWLHIVLAWPLPVLLGFHVLKTYYY
jgi:nitrite reductase (NADH) large subunit